VIASDSRSWRPGGMHHHQGGNFREGRGTRSSSNAICRCDDHHRRRWELIVLFSKNCINGRKRAIQSALENTSEKALAIVIFMMSHGEGDLGRGSRKNLLR